jgi:hypothetical protein
LSGRHWGARHPLTGPRHCFRLTPAQRRAGGFIMRLKILAVLSGIILVIGLIISALLVMNSQDVGALERGLPEQAQQAAHTAGLQWAADAQAREAWLALQSEQGWVREVFLLGTGAARADAATAAANRLIELSRDRAEFPGPEGTFAVFVDMEGVGIGRNNGTLMRGERLGQHIAALWEQVAKGQAASGVWFSLERQEQLFVSLVPVAGPQGIVGAVALGTPISDEALARASQMTLGAPLVVAAVRGDSLVLVAKSRAGSEQVLGPAAAQLAKQALSNSAVVPSPVVLPVGLHDGQGTAPPSVAVAIAALANVETGLVVLGLAQTAVPSAVGKLLWGVWAVVGLGLLVAGVASFLLGAYFSDPIAKLEDGLLQVIGGDEDLRFDLEHAELGPLVSRINTLLDSFERERPRAEEVSAEPPLPD